MLCLEDIYRMDINSLKKSPVFWSRLGFTYDPPVKNREGKPFAFNEDFSEQIKFHRDFLKAGVKIHTCILHLGWMGVNQFDYTLTDKVLEAIFSAGEDLLFIPRIKLNVPVDWCMENPEDVFVYYGGPTDIEGIRSLVGTDKHDYLGYESAEGYYMSGDSVEKRPNVGGLIARQSFSSKKWLDDAGDALSRLIDRLESSKYADRIIGYHIAYGISGETVSWGRIDGKFGDYGINNRRAFYRFGIKKYGSAKALAKAWGQPQISEENLILPTPTQRAGATDSLDDFLRNNSSGRISMDYDEFASEINVSALNYFAEIIKSKTGKLVGAFYGYSLYIQNAAYSAHLGLDKLLTSPHVDFLASPKAYRRIEIGEPGGEICPAQSVNLKKLFVEELDNRTYLATQNKADIAAGFVAKGLSDTLAVMWRELCKNLAHDSGFWWMDLGGGWFNSEPIMDNISKMIKVAEKVRTLKHESIADVLVLYDERSMMSHKESRDMHSGFLRNLICECSMSGVIHDVYRASDLSHIDLSRYKLIFFSDNIYMDEYTRGVIENLDESVCTVYAYTAGAWSDGGFDLGNCEKITSHRITAANAPSLKADSYDFPMIRAEKIIGGRERSYVLTEPNIDRGTIRNLAEKAGCNIYSRDDGITLYADNRFFGVFSVGLNTSIKMPSVSDYFELISNKIYKNTDTINITEDMPSSIFVRCGCV